MTNQVTLQVTVDPSGAVSGTGTVTSSIRNMTSSATTNLNQLQQSFQNLDRFIQKATSSVNGFFKAVIALDVMKGLLDRLIEVNTMYVQFTATLEAVKGSASKAQDEFEYLLATSNRLGQNVEAMSRNYTRLAASMKHVDSTGESTRHVFEGVATAASVLHLKGYETNGILIAFEQILSKNKLSLEEVQRQLSNRLPDAMGTAARAMGMTQEQFRKGITEGTIHPLEFVLRMANQLKSEYGDAAKKTADSFIGQQARMHNAVMNLYRTVGQAGAMEGLTKILKSITEVLDDPSIGQALGQSLNALFSDFADWISKITTSDIHDFFDGLSGVVKSFVIIMRELIASFSDTVDGKADFLSFCQAIANGMLTIIEVAHTLVAGILAIPAALKYADAAYEVFGRVTSPKALGLFQSKDEKSQYAKDTEAAKARMDAAEKNMTGMSDKFLKNGLLDGARKDINKTFDNLKANRAIRESSPKPIRKDFGQGGIMDEDTLMKRAAEGGPKPKGKVKKKGRDPDTIFNTESVNLAKAAATSMLEYNNIMNDNLAIENKHLTQLEIKFRYDRDYLKLSTKQKEALRELAKEADIAAAKEAAAQAFQADKLALNRSIYQTELDLLDVAEFRSSAETKHQREFEEKLKFDSKYKMFTKEMIDLERERAKSLDELTMKLEGARKVEASRYSTAILQLSVNRDMASMNKGVAANRYTEFEKTKDTIRKGGENFSMAPEDKLKLLEDAKARDVANMNRDTRVTGFNVEEQFRQWNFEATLIGKTRFEIQKLTEQKKVYDSFRMAGIDLQLEENKAMKDYADILSENVGGAVDQLKARSEDWMLGMKSGLATYLDDVSNVAKNMEQLTTKVFKGMEDSLVSFIMTGKLDFKGFAMMIIEELVRIMVQMVIMKPIIEAFKMSMDGGEGGGMGFMSMLFSAKGNVFNSGRRYAKGGAFSNKVVDSPTNFMMNQMGERGPEAVMPLTRDPQGRLGVRTSGEGGGGVGNVSVSVTIVNGQESAEVKTGDDERGMQLADRVKAVTLQVLHEEMRSGGILSSVRK